MIKSKLGNRIFIYMMLVSLLPLVISQIYLTQVYEKNIQDRIQENGVLLQQSCVNDFESFMTNIEFLSNTCFDSSVQKIFENRATDSGSLYINNEELIKYFNSRLDLFDILKSLEAVTIELDNEITYHIKDKIVLEDELKNELSIELQEQYKYHEIRNINNDSNSLLYARKIYSITEFGKYLGTIYIKVNKSQVEQCFSQYNNLQNSITVVENMAGEVLYTNYNNAETSLLEFVDKEYLSQNYMHAKYNLPDYGMKVFVYDDLSTVLQPVKQLSNMNVFIMVFSLIAIFFMGRALSESVVKPVLKLREGMKQMKGGDFKWNIEIEGDNEITELCDSFNEMIDEMDVLVNQVYLKEISKNEAVIASLTAQINPHFLYNTLEMVKSMAEIEGISEIGDIAKSLSLLFRYSTKIDEPLATVEEELNNLKHYIKIINARFGDKIIIEIDAEDKLLKCSIIKLCLQPLIENSINHGLTTNRGKGKIQIKLTYDDNNIYIQHIDSGVGMDVAKMTLLQQQLDDNIYVKNERSGGVGLHNINRRIKLYYGKEYGLQLSNYEGHGFCVSIVIPIKYV